MTHNWNTYSTCGTAMISVVTLCFTLILNIIRCQIFLSPGAILQCVPNIQGRRNHFLAGDIERLSIMLLGNSLDTSRYPMRTLCQALFPDDCAEEGSNHDQVCTVHHLEPQMESNTDYTCVHHLTTGHIKYINVEYYI